MYTYGHICSKLLKTRERERERERERGRERARARLLSWCCDIVMMGSTGEKKLNPTNVGTVKISQEGVLHADMAQGYSHSRLPMEDSFLQLLHEMTASSNASYVLHSWPSGWFTHFPDSSFLGGQPRSKVPRKLCPSHMKDRGQKRTH